MWPWTKDKPATIVEIAKSAGLVGTRGRIITSTIGSSGYNDTPKGWTSLEFMAELMPPLGLEKFLRMMMNDPIVGGLMMHLCFSMKRIKWDIVGDNADLVRDQMINMETPLEQVFLEMASAFIFGFYIGENIWGLDGGKARLIDIEPRFQTSIQSINDEEGNVVQFSAEMGEARIPYTKCLHHTFVSFARNPWGIALLRHIYKPYYYKVSVEATEAVGLDRDLTGLPVMTAPEGFDFTAADSDSPNYQPQVEDTLKWAMELVSNVRKDQQQGIVKPNGWTFDIVRGENRSSVPTTEIISRYNTEMAAGLLENFLTLGAFASTNNANTVTHVNNFVSVCEAYASAIADSLSLQIFRRICLYHGKDKFPRLRTRITNFSILKDLAQYVAKLTDSGIIMANQALEKAMLDFANLPENDEDIGWGADGMAKAPKAIKPKIPNEEPKTPEGGE